MKSFISLLFVSSIVLTSCKNDSEVNNNNTPTIVVPFTEVGNQMKSQAASEQQAVNNATMPTTSVAKGMNPAHGQPGHRCDIPVGAPLNAPAVATNQQNTNASTTAVTTTPVQMTSNQAESTTTAEGMNPPHGQANHRCDIAVGAPLPNE